jgi:competence protein ComEA
MELYTRRQLVLLLGLLGAALAGLGVEHWRARHPDLVDRLEQWDRTPAGAGGATAARPASTADGDDAGSGPSAIRDSAEPGHRASGPGVDPRLGPADAGVSPGAGLASEPRARSPRHAVPGARSRPGPGDAARATAREGPAHRAVKLPSAPTGEPPPGPLDLNRAGPEELVRLPGVGPALAARIVAAREAGGRFASVDDLAQVRGLGRAEIDRLRPLVVVGE